MAAFRKNGNTFRSYLSSPCSMSCENVLLGIVVALLIWPGLRVVSQTISKQDVVLQIIVPYQSSSETKLQNTHVFQKETINHGLETEYKQLRSRFHIDTWLNFTQTKSPNEILKLFCNQIFYKQVNTLLILNHGTDVEQSNDYIMNLAKHMGYPVISWDPKYPGALESVEDSRVLQIAPTVYHQCQGMVKVLNRYNWTEFSIVTTKTSSNNDFVSCMKDMVDKTSQKQGFVTTDKYKILTVVEVDYNMYDDEEDIRTTITSALQQLVRTVSRVILLHASQTEAQTIIEMAVEMGLTDAKYMWILTSSSVGKLGRYAKSYPVGTLGISYNNSDEMIQESMKTAIKVWALALNKIATYTGLLTRNMYPSHSCNASRIKFWHDGRYLYRAMREVVMNSSSDPLVSFNENGVIENVELMIYNVRPTPAPKWSRRKNYVKWDQVGSIVPKRVGGKIEMDIEMEEIVWPGGSVYPPKGKPDKRFFRIVTLREPPYIMYVPPDSTTGQCRGHSVPCKLNPVYGPLAYKNVTYDKNGMVEYCCTGLCVDLLNILSFRMNFDYEMYEVHDGEWGIKKNNTWNGLIKEMLENKADMVITSIKINNQRATAMDFSTPFLETGITIMVALRKGAISATAFLEPFDKPSWLLVMLVCIPVVATAIFATEWLSPYALNRSYPVYAEPYDYPSWCLILVFSVHATGASIFIFEWMSPSGLNKGRTPLREHKFSLFRSFWLIWAMLFGASVTTDNPRGTSSRFLANVWALFALVFLASYTANLAAFMITIDEYYDLTGIEDWRLMKPKSVTPPFRFATKPGGSTEDNLRKNYPEMHRYMQKYNQTGVPEGIEALKTGKIHAFIYDATVLEYEAGLDNDCELITVGKWYAMTGYGVGFPKGSTYIEEVNEIILNLQKEGELDRMVKFWLAGACHAKKDKKDKSSHNIGILNFTSAFILLATGVLLGTILLLLEHCYFKFGRKCLKKYDKTGCCSLVSLSMGKSLTFEQSVMDAIDYHKKHRCKDPLCETQLWKARHELDLAFLKIERLREELTSLESRSIELQPTRVCVEENSRPSEPNGNLLVNNKVNNPDSIYETPDSVRKRQNNHVVHLPPITYKNLDAINDKERLSNEFKGVELSELDKRRLQFRRSPSYTNAMSIDSDKDNNSGKPNNNPGVIDKVIRVTEKSGDQNTSENDSVEKMPPPVNYTDKQFSPRRCPSYSQAVEDSPVLDLSTNPESQKHNTRTRFYDGKYYVGVAADNDDSAL